MNRVRENPFERLTRERNETREVLELSTDMVVELIAYLQSGKFSVPDGDYVHVRTDMLPKLYNLRSRMTGSL